MKRAQSPQILAATPAGRSLLFHLDAGEGVPRHQHPGASIVLAVLGGRLWVETDGPRELGAGEVLTHDGDHPIALEARQLATRVLVTLLHRSPS